MSIARFAAALVLALLLAGPISIWPINLPNNFALYTKHEANRKIFFNST